MQYQNINRHTSVCIYFISAIGVLYALHDFLSEHTFKLSLHWLIVLLSSYLIYKSVHYLLFTPVIQDKPELERVEGHRAIQEAFDEEPQEPASSKAFSAKEEDVDVNNTLDLQTIATEFHTWLNESIKDPAKRDQFDINTGHMIFTNSFTYGDEAVFISNKVFTLYQAETQIEPEIIKEALIDNDILDKHSYDLKLNNKHIELFKVYGLELNQEELTCYQIRIRQDGK